MSIVFFSYLEECLEVSTIRCVCGIIIMNYSYDDLVELMAYIFLRKRFRLWPCNGRLEILSRVIIKSILYFRWEINNTNFKKHSKYCKYCINRTRVNKYRKYPKTTPWRYDPNWVITPWRLDIEFEDKSNIFAMAEILDFL